MFPISLLKNGKVKGGSGFVLRSERKSGESVKWVIVGSPVPKYDEWYPPAGLLQDRHTTGSINEDGRVPMSVKSAQAFLEKIKADEVFRQSLEQAASDEARKKLVAEAGFDFTKEELKEAAGVSGGPQKIEEKDLQAVAGGGAASWVTATGSAAAGAIGAAAAAI
jgi:predicted ribosomally synthesized peptide with nif11-like leader